MNEQDFPHKIFLTVLLNLHCQKEHTPEFALAALLELDFYNNSLYPFSSFRSPLILNLNHSPLTFKENLFR